MECLGRIPSFPQRSERFAPLSSHNPNKQPWDAETHSSIWDDLTSWASSWESPHHPPPPPPLFSRNYDLLLYHRITRRYSCPSWFSLPLSFPPWNAAWAWPCESPLPHWPHQSPSVQLRCAADPDLTPTLRHSPLVRPVTTGRLFLLSCHVSRDVRALLCVWSPDVFRDVPGVWEMWCGRPSLTIPQKSLWSTFCAASRCKMQQSPMAPMPQFKNAQHLGHGEFHCIRDRRHVCCVGFNPLLSESW